MASNISRAPFGIMPRRFRPAVHVALVAGYVALCTIAVSAQPTERTVSGTVMDRNHEPLAGAIVQVHSENTLNVMSYITDRSGSYIFRHLSSEDDYEVFATYRGSRSKQRRLSKFDSKPDRQFKLVIKLH